MSKQISIVIPLYNEEESLSPLWDWIQKTLSDKYTYEVLFIDDGSKDDSWKVIEGLAKNNSKIRGIKFQRNYGKSAALQKGFEACQGDVVVTMDADLQDSPEEIPELYDMIIKEDYDLVSGWKKKRHDPLSKTIPTKLYNWAARRITGIYLHDFNCGLKAYKRSVVKSIELYGDMHRYVPALAKYAGFTNIGEKVVQHKARQFGVTKFGLNRFLNGPLDLITVAFMGKFGKKPMHFFGALGTLMFLIGFLLIFYLGIDKLFIHQNARLLAERSEFYVSLIAMVIGVQFFMTGFISELIGRNSTHRNVYLIEKRIPESSNEA
ncbi:MAG: glycosyltransferase family 2 protein [Crocinitomicaceae bacterium]|nr:glycosyltransferase family 2 protein [Crocinitomicaceae bacterium]MDB4606463.1 glycosyltransferase family 2 protein [Crocinitomicaceae bacterium]MDG1351245.1 glycosyltransferase family 2 protein [Crocinitomicaceae bacterium]MDG2504530.1 glycosyltransferase family 2 protein [Crocinitomicaceae bacterium]